jgi:DNA-binding response OmpR family regulator
MAIVEHAKSTNNFDSSYTFGQYRLLDLRRVAPVPAAARSRKQCLNLRQLDHSAEEMIEGERAMADSGPIILVVDNDRAERVAIAAALRAAGFAVVAAHDRGAGAAMSRGRFAGAVIALPDGGIEFLRRARRRQPDLQALLVIEPAALPLPDAGDDTLVRRPFDARQLLSRVFELVLCEAEDRAPHHRHAAEFGIAAAKLACLYRRRAAATAAGASRLAHDLTRQIGETRAMHRGLASRNGQRRPRGHLLTAD